MKYFRKTISLSMCILFALIVASCASPNLTQNSKLTVVVSIVPQETFVNKVAGELVDVITAVPPGKSPSNYAPTPQEFEKLSRSSVYFSIGIPAEQTYVLPDLKKVNSEIEIIDLAGIVNEKYVEISFSEGSRDSHIWLSPKRAIVMVEIIALELSKIDSQNSDIFRKNSQAYIAELKQLDLDVKKILSTVKNKTFIIFHPSLGYFADDYGLTMISLENDGKEATPKDFQRVIDIANEQGIKTVFYQSEIDSRQSRILAAEIGGKAVMISPLASDYIENLKNIATALAKQ